MWTKAPDYSTLEPSGTSRRTKRLKRFYEDRRLETDHAGFVCPGRPIGTSGRDAQWQTCGTNHWFGRPGRRRSAPCPEREILVVDRPAAQRENNQPGCIGETAGKGLVER